MNFYTCNNPVNLTMLNNAFNMSTFILSHLGKSNTLNQRSSSNMLIKSNQNFTETNSCKWILKETYANVYPSKQHKSRPGSWLTDPTFVM